MTRPGLLAFQRPSVEQRFLDLMNPPAPSVTMRSPMPYTTPSGASLRRLRTRSSLRISRSAAPCASRGDAVRAGRNARLDDLASPRLPAAPKTMADAFRQPLTSPTGGHAAAALAGLEYGGSSPQLTRRVRVWRGWVRLVSRRTPMPLRRNGSRHCYAKARPRPPSR